MVRKILVLAFALMSGLLLTLAGFQLVGIAQTATSIANQTPQKNEPLTSKMVGAGSKPAIVTKNKNNPDKRFEKIPYVTINMTVIKMIESSNNPKAYNERSKASGLYQITPIVLKEWNTFHKNEKYSLADLFSPYINTKIAFWYMAKRIPEMLRYFQKNITLENLIISWNAGIAYVVKQKPIPEETINFITKYKTLLSQVL